MAEAQPFERAVRVESIPEGGLERAIEASEAERLALAKIHGLAGLAHLSGAFTLRRAGRGVFRVEGVVHAEATQICVVSLEPMDVVVDEPVDLRFAAPAGESAARRAAPRPADVVAVDGDGDDPPDPILDGKIDLGAVAAEFMALGLDPYPRKPGTAFAPSPDESGKGS